MAIIESFSVLAAGNLGGIAVCLLIYLPTYLS